MDSTFSVVFTFPLYYHSDWSGYDTQDGYKSNTRADQPESFLLHPGRKVVMAHAVVVIGPTELLATTFPIASKDCSQGEVPGNVISFAVVGAHGSA